MPRSLNWHVVPVRVARPGSRPRKQSRHVNDDLARSPILVREKVRERQGRILTGLQRIHGANTATLQQAIRTTHFRDHERIAGPVSAWILRHHIAKPIQASRRVMEQLRAEAGLKNGSPSA